MYTAAQSTRESGAASDLVREARHRAGLTQLELAHRAGVTQSVVSTYENGRREPSIVMLQRLLGAAGFAASLDLQPVVVSMTVRERIDRARREIVRECAVLGGTCVHYIGTKGKARDDGPVQFMVDLRPGVGLFALFRMQDRIEELVAERASVTSVDSYDAWDRATLLREAVAL